MLLFNIFELRLCLTKQKIKLEQLVFQVRINQAPVCTYLIKPTQSTFLGALFPSIMSGWFTTTGIDCLVQMGNKRKETFPGTQRRIITG